MSILSKRQVAAIFLMALIPFATYALFRTDLRGFDSYAFYEQSCGNFTVNNVPPLAEFATKLVPCNILAVKFTLFLLFFASLLGIAYLGSLFDAKRGWLAVLFSFLSPALFFEATRFENDQFAAPFLIWSAYFFYKARKTKQKKFDLAALALILFAAGFWYGAIYWLLAFALTSLVLALPGIIAIALFARQIFDNALPKAVSESLPAIGLAMVGGLALGFSLLPTIMYPQVVVFLLLMVLQIKFAWFIAPLLSVGVLMFYVNPKLEKNRAARQVQGILLMSAIFLVVVWGLALQSHPPHLYQWQAVEYAIQESDDGFVWCDWDFGYWVMHKGGTPSQFGGGKQQPFGKGIVLTEHEIDCQLLKRFEEVSVWRC